MLLRHKLSLRRGQLRNCVAAGVAAWLKFARRCQVTDCVVTNVRRCQMSRCVANGRCEVDVRAL